MRLKKGILHFTVIYVQNACVSLCSNNFAYIKMADSTKLENDAHRSGLSGLIAYLGSMDDQRIDLKTISAPDHWLTLEQE